MTSLVPQVILKLLQHKEAKSDVGSAMIVYQISVFRFMCLLDIISVFTLVNYKWLCSELLCPMIVYVFDCIQIYAKNHLLLKQISKLL
jgi:hypothetical protein